VVVIFLKERAEVIKKIKINARKTALESHRRRRDYNKYWKTNNLMLIQIVKLYLTLFILIVKTTADILDFILYLNN